MKFNILTIFPEMFDILNYSIVKRAKEKGRIEINILNIRDFSRDIHKRVDFPPYGGGAGMIMSAQCIYDAYKYLKKDNENTRVIYLSPKGKKLDNKEVQRLTNYSNITFLCGHYEGVDQRIIDEIVDEEISVGDYILSNGEMPAIILIDAITRQIDGVISKESLEDESFNDGLLEYPQYTRPKTFLKKDVPEILLSGNHKEIDKFRKKQSLKETYLKRPDLLRGKALDKLEKFQREYLEEIIKEEEKNGHY